MPPVLNAIDPENCVSVEVRADVVTIAVPTIVCAVNVLIVVVGAYISALIVVAVPADCAA